MSPTIFRPTLRAATAALLFATTPATARALQECNPQAPVHERASCVLATPAGKRALVMVGEVGKGDLETRRAHAALTPSFARYVLTHADRAAASAALEGATADAFQKHTGRSLAQWRTDWTASLAASPATR
jgi:erythromycin esterase-like protein